MQGAYIGCGGRMSNIFLTIEISDIKETDFLHYCGMVKKIMGNEFIGNEVLKIRQEYRLSILESQILNIVELSFSLFFYLWDLFRYEKTGNNSKVVRSLSADEIIFLKLYSLHISAQYAVQKIKKLIPEIMLSKFMPQVASGFPSSFFNEFHDDPDELVKLIVYQYRNALTQDCSSKDLNFRVVNEDTFLRFTISFLLMLDFSVMSVIAKPNFAELTPSAEKFSFLIEGDGVTGFKVGEKLREKRASGPDFNDVGGNREAKNEFMEIAKAWKNQKIYNKWGTRPPKGVLLVGPPGCGKTFMTRAFANEIGLPITIINVDDVVSSFYGQSAINIARLLDNEGVIFIDEIDSLGRKRSERSDEETVRVVNVLNQKLAGFEAQEEGNEFKRIFVAATNRVQDMDPALLRSGRFDRIIYLSYPDKEAIQEILRIHIKKIKARAGRELFKKLDFLLVTDIMHEREFSGADIEEIARRVTAKKAQVEIADGNTSLIATEDILSEIKFFERDPDMQRMRASFMMES